MDTWINQKALAEKLIDLARRIKRGAVSVRSVATHQYAREDRSPVSTFRISYCRSRKRGVRT